MPIVFRFASVAGVAEKGPLALYSTRAASRSRNHWQHVLFIWTRDTARCTERETPDSHLNTADIFPLVLFFLNTELQTHLCHIVHSWSKLMSIWWSGAERDLSLATPLATLLKTAVFVPFFLARKTRNRCIFLHPHQTGDFSDAHFSFASAPGMSQMSVEKVHQPNELQ